MCKSLDHSRKGWNWSLRSEINIYYWYYLFKKNRIQQWRVKIAECLNWRSQLVNTLHRLRPNIRQINVALLQHVLNTSQSWVVTIGLWRPRYVGLLVETNKSTRFLNIKGDPLPAGCGLYYFYSQVKNFIIFNYMKIYRQVVLYFHVYVCKNIYTYY